MRWEKDVARPGWQIAGIALREPSKAVAIGHRTGDPVVREARAVVWSAHRGTAYVAVASIEDTGASSPFLPAWPRSANTGQRPVVAASASRGP